MEVATGNGIRARAMGLGASSETKRPGGMLRGMTQPTPTKAPAPIRRVFPGPHTKTQRGPTKACFSMIKRPDPRVWAMMLVRRLI